MANGFGDLSNSISKITDSAKASYQAQQNAVVKPVTTASMFGDAKTFSDAGDYAAANRVITDYRLQIGNKNSPMYKAQYTYWDEANGDEQKTLAAESDLLDMYNAVNDAVGKGYSDSWIKNNISAKNYSGLASLTNDTVLTRQLQYLGDDTINGMIYAARNPSDELSNADILSAMGMYYLGGGDKYKPDYKSEAAKDPTSEVYHPYMQGNHATGEVAEKNTTEAKEQLARFQADMRARLEAGESSDKVYSSMFENNMEGLRADYPKLFDMEYARTNKTAIDLTEDVDFAGPYVKEWMDGLADEIGTTKKTNALVELLSQQTASFEENVPSNYQELVMSMYMRDKGVEKMDINSFAELDAWLKEYGLDKGAENFSKAYGEAVSKFSAKWDKGDADYSKFTPATFISSAGENADEATNKAQVNFRLGMMSYLAGMPVTDNNAKAFVTNYSWLLGMYESEDKEGTYIKFANSNSRSKAVGTKLNNALVKLDTARQNGEISDEAYFDCYLEIAAVYDTYREEGGTPISATSGGMFSNAGVTSDFDDYLHNSFSEDKQSLEDRLTAKINQSIETGKADREARIAAHKSEVSQQYGGWIRSENNGEKVEDADFAEVKGIQIDVKAKTGFTSDEFDVDYYNARNFAAAARPRMGYDQTDLEKEYYKEYDSLIAYDVVAKVDDIERLAIYNNVSFAEAAQMMGINDVDQYVLEQTDVVHNECMDILESVYDVTRALVANPTKMKAEDLYESGLITKEQLDRFGDAFGEDQALYNNYYVRVKMAKDQGKEAYIKGAADTYKEAIGKRQPASDEARGNSASIKDIAVNGIQSGAITHLNSWLTATLGWLEKTPEERAEYYRTQYSPQAYRQVLSEAISSYDDPAIRDAMQSQLNNYTGDIYKFDFDPNKIIGLANRAKQEATDRQQALNDEMKELLTPDAYNWYVTTGSATNSVLLSTEAILLSKMFTKAGASPSMASLLGQMFTTAPVEGGEAAYELKQAGVSGDKARLAGLLIGATTAISEHGLEGVINKAAYRSGLAKSIDSIGKIDTAARAMQFSKALTDRNLNRTAAKLLTFSAKGFMGAINFGSGRAIGGVFEGLQEFQQDFTSDAFKALFSGDASYIKTSEEYSDLIEDTFKSSLLQQLNPMSMYRGITDFARSQTQQNRFGNIARETATELAAEGTSQIGTAQTALDAALQSLDDVTQEREASMDVLKAANFAALVEQETVKRLVDPAVTLHNSDTVKRINTLTTEANALLSQIDEYNAKVQEVTEHAEEARLAIEDGDVSKEALDRLTDTTDLLRTLDVNINNAQTEYSAKNDELSQLKAERRAEAQRIYDEANAAAIESVTDEAVRDAVERAKNTIDQFTENLKAAKDKVTTARDNLRNTIDYYRNKFISFSQEMRLLAARTNNEVEARFGIDAPISDDLVEMAVAVADVFDDIDVDAAVEQEQSYKASLLKQMEMSFPGYKVRYESLGRGNHGKVVMDGGDGTIILNRDASTWELMSGELGYEIGKLAAVGMGDDYKNLYQTVTETVYGSQDATFAAVGATAERLISEGANPDVNAADSAYLKAQDEVFATAISRLLSGEFMGNNWVQSLNDKAPMLANSIFDWMAMRAKEFKKLARHGDKKMKARYNELAKVLKNFSTTLKRNTSEGFSGEQETVDLMLIPNEEQTTNDAETFLNGLVNGSKLRYTGEKSLPFLQRNSEGKFFLDSGDVDSKTRDLINDVIDAGMGAQYNASLGAESQVDALIEQIDELVGESTSSQPTEESVPEQPAPEQTEKDIPAKPDDKKAAKLADLQNKLDRLMELDDADYQFIVENSQTTTTNITGEETVMIGEANEGQEAAVAKARKRRERRAAQIAKIQTQQQALQAELNNDYSVQEGSNVNPFAQSQTTEQDNAEQQTEQPAPTETEQPVAAPTNERDDVRKKIAESLKATLTNISEFSEDDQLTILGRVRGAIEYIRKGRADDPTNTPVALMRNALNKANAIVYERVGSTSQVDAFVENVATSLYGSVGNVDTSMLDSNVGAVTTTNRLKAADMGSLIAVLGSHVLNSIERAAADGTTMELTGNSRQDNEALFSSWLRSGMTEYGETDEVKRFGDKLTIDLGKTSDGRKLLKILDETKDGLTRWYNASEWGKIGAYVRTLGENTPSGKTGWWTKTKAYFLGDDVLADAIDNLTHYETDLRGQVRYQPYAQGITNMWVGDSEAANGFIDLDRKPVFGAFTLHEGMQMPFSKAYFEAHRDYIWDTTGKLLALESILDRMLRGQNPFSDTSQVTDYLGLNGHLTQENVEAAIQKVKYKADGSLSEIGQAAENVRTWWNNVMLQAVKEGVLSQELYDQFQRDNPHYAPLQRDMSARDAGDVNSGSVTVNVGGDVISDAAGLRFHKAKGHSDRAIINPMLTFTDQAQVIANALIRNRMAREFVRAYDMAPNETIGVFGKEVTNDQADVMKRRGQNVLNVYYGDGTHRSFVMNNAELFNLMSGTEQTDNAFRKVVSLIGKGTRFMAAMTTSNNPLFAIANALRDYQTSVNYGSWTSNYLFGSWKWFVAFGEALRYTFSKEWNKWINNSNVGAANQQMKDFLAFGGEGFTRRSLTTQHQNDSYNAVMGESFIRRTFDMAKHLITFNSLNDAIEMASRYVEYKYGKNETRDSEGATDQSKFNAFMDSREVTVDFAQVGKGDVARVIRAVVPFFNATLQGWYRTGRMFTEAERDRLPARLTKTVINTAISGAMSAAMCLFGSKIFGGKDEDWDDQAEEYLKLSDEMRQDYILIPLSGFGIISNRDMIRIPLLQDALGKVCYNMGRQAIESIYRVAHGEDVSFSAIAGDMAGIAFSVLIKDPFLRDTIATPWLDVKANNTYYDTQLVSDYLMENYDAAKWGNQTTGRIFFQASAAYRNLMRAWGRTPNDLRSSPAGLEYLFKQYTGVIGQLVLPAISRDRYTGEETGFFSGLATTIKNRFSLDAESTNDISTNYTKAKKYLSSISSLNENEEGIAPLSSMLTSTERLEAKEEAKKALAKEGVLKEIDNSIKELWSRYNDIMVDDKLTEDERIAQSEALRKEINRLQQEGIAYVEDYKKRWSSDLNWIEAAADGWNGAMQTLKDSGPGIASTQPELTEVRAAVPGVGDIAQTIPVGQAEPQITPVAAPDLTGNVTQAVTGERAETPVTQPLGQTAKQPTPEMLKAATDFSGGAGTNIGKSINELLAANPNGIKGRTIDTSKWAYNINEIAATRKAGGDVAAKYNEIAQRMKGKTPSAQPKSSNYNVASNVGDVSKYYNTTRSVSGDTLSRMRMRDLYGDSLSEKYYAELEQMMEHTSGDILPLPQTSFKQSKVEYIIADYPGAETDMVNWFASYYIPACNELMASSAYDKASADDKLEMLSGIRSEARKVAKTNFLAKYVS